MADVRIFIIKVNIAEQGRIVAQITAGLLRHHLTSSTDVNGTWGEPVVGKPRRISQIQTDICIHYLTHQVRINGCMDE